MQDQVTAPKDVILIATPVSPEFQFGISALGCLPIIRIENGVGRDMHAVPDWSAANEVHILSPFPKISTLLHIQSSFCLPRI